MHPEHLQRQHYAQTAHLYDVAVGNEPEHELALYLATGFIDSLKAESVLDVGAGTGRAIRFLRAHRPTLTTRGIEPVAELRRVAYDSGIPTDCLIAGDGYHLPFPDDSFDVVTEFGMLHHVADPESVVREMLRVARYGICLSDTNNIGQGQMVGRIIKTVCFTLGLWKALSFMRTGGRRSVYEPHDGLWYYYTVFSHLSDLRRRCNTIHVINTRGISIAPLFSASHALILATKRAALEKSPFYSQLR